MTVGPWKFTLALAALAYAGMRGWEVTWLEVLLGSVALGVGEVLDRQAEQRRTEKLAQDVAAKLKQAEL